MGLRSYRFSEFIQLDKLYPGGLSNDLDSMDTFLKSIEKGTVEIVKENVESMEQEMENDIIIDDEVFSNIDFFDYKSSSSALNIIYNSTLISIYSFLETRMKHFYELLKDQQNIKINKKDGESNILFYKRKLADEFSIDFSEVNLDWEEICSYTLLRNALTHSHIQEADISKKIIDYQKIINMEFLTTEVESTVLVFQINDFNFLSLFFKKVSKFLNFICYERR
jgi:hypothetical protein